MAPRCSTCSVSTLVPFLYPSLLRTRLRLHQRATQTRSSSTNTVNDLPESRLNPAPEDYSSPKFADKAHLTLYAGRGGSGCVSFLREAFLPDGPPNGGDGGNGGNIYIQAAHGETSLHKLARQRFVRAGRGKNGQGSARSGTRGEDVIITVPVGTIVRELERDDPVAEEEMEVKSYMALMKEKRKSENRAAEEEKQRKKRLEREGVTVADETEDEIVDQVRKTWQEEEAEEAQQLRDPRSHKWVLYPGMGKGDFDQSTFPKLPRRDRPLHQPPAPIQLDLSRPTTQPVLLATGGVGGLGNPHFNSRAHPRPLFATKGDEAVTMKIELELKLLADVGLVGLPNAGKSTLLRAMTNSRTRVGSWAFTTLQPNIGTVVLDKYSGRPELLRAAEDEVGPRTRFTVADIPGLIEGAHLDHGLGIAFLRHVERAGVLAFVVDLSAGDAVKALNALWNEVGLYARMREEEDAHDEAAANIDWSLDSSDDPSDSTPPTRNLMEADLVGGDQPAAAGHIAGKPWFVVATKADLPETKENYKRLKEYLDAITNGDVGHPSAVEGAWTKKCTAIPVSAINQQGVDRIVHWTVGLLDE